MEHIIFGWKGSGKSELMRIQLGMTPEQYQDFAERQRTAYLRVLNADKELRNARAEWMESCIVRTDLQHERGE